MKLFWAYLWNNWWHVLDIRGCVQFTHCIRDLLLHLKIHALQRFLLQRDLRSKVRHLQRDIHLEVQHMMMLCIRGVSLLFPFVILRSSSLLMLCLDKFANSNIPNVGFQLANQRPSFRWMA